MKKTLKVSQANVNDFVPAIAFKETSVYGDNGSITEI